MSEGNVRNPSTRKRSQVVESPSYFKAPESPEGTSVYGAPETDLIPSKDPNFVYQWVLRDHLSNYLRPRKVGDPATGFETMSAWEVVRDDNAAELGRTRDDNGKPVDSLLQHGRMVAIRIPASEYAKLERAGAKMAKTRDARLARGETQNWEGKASFQDGVTSGFNAPMPAFLNR